MRLFDLHCDTLYECATKQIDMKINDLQLSLDKGAKFLPWVQCFAVWMPDELRGQKAVEHFDRCYDYFLRQIDKHSDYIVQYKNSCDFSQKDRRCIAVLAVEGGSVFAGQLNRVQYLKSCGVAAVTLTWNGENELSDGIMSDGGRGLSPFGFECVKEMEKQCIIVDVSHLSPKGFWDVDSVSTRPYIATHSNSKKICPHVRNLSDEQFSAICKKGGLVGINLYTQFVNQKDDYSFFELKQHIDHFLSLGGEDTLAIGTDFDGADMPSCISGIDKLDRLYYYLLESGYSQQLVDRIFFDNAFLFMQNMLFNGR